MNPKELKRVRWNDKREYVKEMHRKLNEWCDQQNPPPKVIEEYEENGIVVKRYEAR